MVIDAARHLQAIVVVGFKTRRNCLGKKNRNGVACTEFWERVGFQNRLAGFNSSAVRSSESSKGRTSGFDPENLGPNPSSEAKMRYKGKKGKAWEKVRLYVKAKEKDCYTCGAKALMGINAQSGHYLPVGLVGSNNVLSWDARQIHLQCSRCNGVGQGQAVAYRARLIKDYGEKVVKELEARRWKVDKVKDWDAIIEYYEKLFEGLV